MKTAILSLLLFASNVQASPVCADLFEAKPAISPKSPEQTRRSVESISRRAELPFFLKKSSHGNVPVILMNARTMPALTDVLNQSVGIQILLQPGTPYSDHGMLRIGGVKSHGGELKSVQIDWGLPGWRGGTPGAFDEIHTTGLAWRDLRARLERNESLNRYTLKTVEAVFVLTKKEREDLEYYHRVRRAAIFARGFVDINGVLQPQIPNRMAAFEDCFMYCRGVELKSHADRIIDHLRSYGPYEVESILSSPEAKEFLGRARTKIMRTDWWTENGLHPQLVATPTEVAKLKRILPDLVKNQDGSVRESAFVFANWLVALEATRIAHRVYSKLGITDSYGMANEIENPRISAILIYDSPDQAPRFRDATYVTPGKEEYAGWGDGKGESIRPYRDQFKAN